jgi:hypothetical protein
MSFERAFFPRAPASLPAFFNGSFHSMLPVIDP